MLHDQSLIIDQHGINHKVRIFDFTPYYRHANPALSATTRCLKTNGCITFPILTIMNGINPRPKSYKSCHRYSDSHLCGIAYEKDSNQLEE